MQKQKERCDMLTRWQPFGDVRGEMSRLHDEMNRLFGRYGNGGREFSPGGYPPLNLWEDESNLYVEAELPGFNLDDLEMYITGDNQLSIKGERKQPELENGTWHRQERGYGNFCRLMELPGAVDSDNVSAEFKTGVLTVTLPKKEKAKPQRIEVKTR
jgi:HSP20 family protein